MFEKIEQRHFQARIFNIYEPTKLNLLSEITLKV